MEALVRRMRQVGSNWKRSQVIDCFLVLLGACDGNPDALPRPLRSRLIEIDHLARTRGTSAASILDAPEALMLALIEVLEQQSEEKKLGAAAACRAFLGASGIAKPPSPVPFFVGRNRKVSA